MMIVLPFFLTLVFVSSVDSLSFTINQNSEKVSKKNRVGPAHDFLLSINMLTSSKLF
jgi:hypothetical protein